MAQMMRRMVFLAFGVVLGSGVASAAPITWVEWTTAVVGTPGSAAGTLPGIAVTYTGQVSSPTQVVGGTNYWVPSTPYLSATVDNAPPCCDIITLTGGTSTGPSTLTFSTPLVNPVMAIVSLGRSNLVVNYDFGQPFDVLSFGPGFWGGPGTLTELAGDVLQGVEGHGVIQFQGTFSAITWTTAQSEFWHGFTIGVADVTAVPEPGTLGLLGLGLASVSRRIRRRVRAETLPART